MTRRPWSLTAAVAVAVSVLAASPATADDAPVPDPVVTTAPAPEPTTAPTTAVPTSTPTVPQGDGGAVDDGGEVALPNPGAPSARHARVLVFGDSFSSTRRYSVKGTKSRPKAWWAHVAEAAGIPASEVMVSAEGGSGLLARGFGSTLVPCSGTTFGDRLGDLAATDPDVVIVEVGRNDVRRCRGGARVVATAAERRAAAERYFVALARAADRQGIARSRVYVMTPWGSSDGAGKVATSTLYEALAKARGFTWITLPSLVRRETIDAIHPNAAGATTLGAWVVRSSDLATMIGSRAAQHAPVPSHAKVLCTGVSACRAAKTSTRGHERVTRRIWGAAPRTSTHYAAFRLSQGVRSAPVLTSTTPRTWRTAALKERAAAQVAQPQRGDIAWWLSAPAGVGATSRGHLAVVESVAHNNSWVVVTELTSRGTFRSVRYAGTSYPRAFLRFTRTDGGPRGLVTGLSAKKGLLAVRGRAVDTDAETKGVRIRVHVTQGSRSWTRTATRTRLGFYHRFSLPGLKRGTATVKVRALDAPGTRGSDRTLRTARLTVR
ncbi:SGNH/GDSL hydrolase family protein [Aeromicrobium tamlense]|uniref:SGNH/GDSL hydrolase family protein n=1 Tax=Aeromicrobium tamlense TaxID=375541 RepID=A0A8I0KGT8_9ACTN|nr:GDSL-type esterase/lipase family protein [Aeromicrobium tamlense]MBD1270081.1 SGNH/GDSL hydrolase family protein [Aeromicrobium tamlense]NYI39261.1 surface antigen/lysophospholipase L1-like esterase [Aeromicrobium tamlense]